MILSDVLKFVEKQGAKFVDLKFIDLPGIWQYTTVTIPQLKEDSFEDGFGLAEYIGIRTQAERLRCESTRLIGAS